MTDNGETSQKKVKMPRLTLYQCPHFRSFRVMWLIHELGIEDDIEFKTLNSFKKETPEYKEYKEKVHPHGTIPALVVEGERTMVESTSMCLYLADLYNKLVPAPALRKDYYDWSLYAAVTLEEITEFLYWQWLVKPETPDTEGIKKMSDKFAIGMKRLTEALEDRKWICGDEFTAADCILGYCVDSAGHELYNKGVLLEDFPKVRDYLKRLQERPAYQKAFKAQWPCGEDKQI